MTSLTEIPARTRLVDVYCPSGHLAAVLVRNASLDAVLVEQRRGRIAPTAVLVDGQLFGAMVTTNDGEGQPRILPIGPASARPETMLCRKCSTRYTLTAAALAEKLEKAKPGRSVARLTLRRLPADTP